MHTFYFPEWHIFNPHKNISIDNKGKFPTIQKIFLMKAFIPSDNDARTWWLYFSASEGIMKDKDKWFTRFQQELRVSVLIMKSNCSVVGQ